MDEVTLIQLNVEKFNTSTRPCISLINDFIGSKVKQSKAKYGSEGTSTPVAIDDSGYQSVDQSKNGSSPLFTSAESVLYDGFKSEEKQSEGKKLHPVVVDDSGENSF